MSACVYRVFHAILSKSEYRVSTEFSVYLTQRTVTGLTVAGARWLARATARPEPVLNRK